MPHRARDTRAKSRVPTSLRTDHPKLPLARRIQSRSRVARAANHPRSAHGDGRPFPGCASAAVQRARCAGPRRGAARRPLGAVCQEHRRCSSRARTRIRSSCCCTAMSAPARPRRPASRWWCAMSRPARPLGSPWRSGCTRYPATATAVDDSVVLAWPAAAWPRLVERYPALSANTLRAVGSRLQETHTRVIEMSTQQVEQRVARALLRLAKQSGRKVEQGVEIAFPISRQDIAQMTGTTLHTVSRLLERLGATRADRERAAAHRAARRSRAGGAGRGGLARLRGFQQILSATVIARRDEEIRGRRRARGPRRHFRSSDYHAGRRSVLLRGRKLTCWPRRRIVSHPRQLCHRDDG